MTLFLLDLIDLSFSSSQILGEKEYTNLRKLFIYYFFDGKKTPMCGIMLKLALCLLSMVSQP